MHANRVRIAMAAARTDTVNHPALHGESLPRTQLHPECETNHARCVLRAIVYRVRGLH